MIREPNSDHVVWLDGEFVCWRDATMHVSSHHYGFGVFEGVRAYAGDGGTFVFRLDDHTQRLFRSAQIMQIAVPDRFDRVYLNGVQLEVLHRNRLGNAYLRPFIFYGGTLGIRPSTKDLRVHVAVMALAWGAPATQPSSEEDARGVTLRTSSFQRHAPSSVLSRAKVNGHYVGGMLALQEAQACGADDALLLDQHGFVTEATGANVFIVRDGWLHTPPLAMVLEGITRDTILTIATAEGYRVAVRQLTRDDVYTADEAFLTGTAAEITPILKVDGRRIGSGSRGPMTSRLQARYADHVRGRGEHRPEWLQPIQSAKARG